MKRLCLTIALALTSAHVAAAQFKAATLPELDDAAMQALAPAIKNIRAEPNTISMKVGQTIPLRTLTIIAVDSSGRERGRLSGFDFKIPKGEAAEAVPRQITAKRAGTAVLTVHYPTSSWKGRSDPRPEATITIEVKP